MEGRPAEDMWHLTIDDLLAAPAETPRLAGPGPFVISLSASTAPVSVPVNGFPEYPNLKVYEIKRNEDGRIRYRLRLGPIETDLEADAILSAVRERYPSAFAANAEEADLRVFKRTAAPAVAKEQPPAPVAEKPAPPAAEQVKCLSTLIAADAPEPPKAKQPEKPKSKVVAPAPLLKVPDPESGVFAIDFDHFLPPIEEHFKDSSAPKSGKHSGSHTHGKHHGSKQHSKSHSHGKHPHGKQQHSKPQPHPKPHKRSKGSAPSGPVVAPVVNSVAAVDAGAAPARPVVAQATPVAAPAKPVVAQAAPVAAPAKAVASAAEPTTRVKSAPSPIAATATAATPPTAAARKPAQFVEPAHDPNAVTDQVAVLTLPADSAGEVEVDDAVESMILVKLDPEVHAELELELELHQDPVPAPVAERDRAAAPAAEAKPIVQPAAPTAGAKPIAQPAVPVAAAAVEIEAFDPAAVLAAIEHPAATSPARESSTRASSQPAPDASRQVPAGGPALETVADIETDVVTLTEVVTGIATITTRAIAQAEPALEVPTLTEVIDTSSSGERDADLESIVARNNAMVDSLQAREVVPSPAQDAVAAKTPPATEVAELELDDVAPIVAQKGDAQPAKPSVAEISAPESEVEFDEIPLADLVVASVAAPSTPASPGRVEASSVPASSSLIDAAMRASAEVAEVESAAPPPAITAPPLASADIEVADIDVVEVVSAVAAVRVEDRDRAQASDSVAALVSPANDTARAVEPPAQPTVVEEAAQLEVVELDLAPSAPRAAIELAPSAPPAAEVQADAGAAHIVLELEATDVATPPAVESGAHAGEKRSTPERVLERVQSSATAASPKNPRAQTNSGNGSLSRRAVVDEPLVIEAAKFPATVATPPVVKAGPVASEPSSRSEPFSETERAAGHASATRIEPVAPRAATNARLEEPAPATPVGAASVDPVAGARSRSGAPGKEKITPPVEILADPLPEMDSTQTIRELTQLELADADASRWFAIQLSLSEEAANPDDVPHLDIFDAYRLYSVAGLDKIGFRHALRLGFFTDQSSAEMVAGYLRSYFDAPEVKRVSQAERDRFVNRRVVPKLDIGATGQHTIIELATAPTVPQRRLSDIARQQGKEPSDSGSLWSRLVAPLKR